MRRRDIRTSIWLSRGLRAFSGPAQDLAIEALAISRVSPWERRAGCSPSARKDVSDDHENEHDQQDGGDGSAAWVRGAARGGLACRHGGKLKPRAAQVAAHFLRDTPALAPPRVAARPFPRRRRAPPRAVQDQVDGRARTDPATTARRS